METAPLNLAHFHERRAERHLKRNRYDEAIKAMETALAYIEDAYKTITIPKAIQVLEAEKWDCSRKLKQINIRQSQYEGSIISSIALPPELKYTDSRHEDPAQCTTISIHQAIENFDAKYTSSTLGTLNVSKDDAMGKNNNSREEESTNWMDELESKDFPSLAPLELPIFELGFESGPAFEDHDN